LPFNPSLSDEAINALDRYVEGEGRVIACYQLPPRLGTSLGFDHAKYVKQDRPGQFAEMRFDGSVPLIPKSVRQKSWNITTLDPVGHRARVIGSWFNDAGQPTGLPAALLSDRGAFFTHILLPDDHETKKRLLASILGELSPALWEGLAKTAMDQVGQVGHCATLEEIAAFLKPYETTDCVATKLASGMQAWGKSRDFFEKKAWPDAMACARDANDLLVQAYLHVPQSPSREGRAFWNHSGAGVYPGDWDRSMKLLHENGFNMVLPNMLWGGSAHYPSDLLPRSGTFEKYGDQIKACCEAAKKYDMEVHVWKVNFNLSNAPKDLVESLRREGRTQVSVSGKPLDWLCPSHPENRKLELASMLEVVGKYPVAGLHFDYIRYPSRESCYCDGCRHRFEEQSGHPVSQWPEECYSGARKEEYNAWRCKQITMLVESVSHEAKRLCPEVKISAAVFGSYPACRESVAQDWPEWVQAGLLDFVCPMDYTEQDSEFVSLVKNQMKLIDGRIPLYPGVGATASNMSLSADRVVGQIHQARTLGASGFTIFNLDPKTAESIVPFIGFGVGAQPAVPPHQTP
jgi:uncharacterized lipoprotein YddW (UPF0748 family)